MSFPGQPNRTLAAGAEVPKRAPDVQIALGELQDALANVESVVERLAAKLQPVRGQSTLTNPAKDSTQRAPRCQLSGEMYQIATRIASVYTHLSELNDDLEV